MKRELFDVANSQSERFSKLSGMDKHDIWMALAPDILELWEYVDRWAINNAHRIIEKRDIENALFEAWATVERKCEEAMNGAGLYPDG